MGSNLIDLPMKFLMPSSFDNATEIAFKTIPSVSKVEIKNVLESMCGLEVEKVRTLNMKGKKKRRGGRLVARPDYKKVYITLKKPLSITHDLYSANAVKTYPAEKQRIANNQLKSSHFAREEDGIKSLWVDYKRQQQIKPEKQLARAGNTDLFAIGTLGQSKSLSNLHSSR